MSIDIICGPMYCGKTTELIRQLSVYKDMNLRVLYVNSFLDTRANTFSTHNPSLKNINHLKSMKLKSLDSVKPEEWDVIGIDECQFFSRLTKNVVRWADKFNVKVICAGLNGDSNRQLFGDLVNLIPHCDSIKKLKGFCVVCITQHKKYTPSIFTLRVNTKTQTKILIGDKYLYKGVCRSCYNKLI